MKTEQVLCLDENYSPDDHEWYGSASLVSRVDGKIDWKTAKMCGGDLDAPTRELLHSKLLTAAKAKGWKWDRAVVVGGN